MKLIKLNILFFIVLGFFATSPMYSQDQDFLAFVKLKNVFMEDPTSMTFDITVSRNSERWYYLANGTFQIYLDTTFFKVTESADLSLELIDSELPLGQVIGPYIFPEDGYVVEPDSIYADRISFTVMGPTDFNDCTPVPFEEELKIGTFRLFSQSGERIPPRINWKTPIFRYQALAFKLERDSTDIRRDRYLDDNLSLVDDDFILADYDTEDTPITNLELDFFDVDYIGNLEVGMQFATLTEYFNLGFTIMRYMKTDPDDVPDLSDFQDTVFTWRPESEYYNELMISRGNTQTGFLYDPLFDMIEYRNIDYCYALYATVENLETQQIEDIYLDYDCISVPNAVIVSAIPSENPFRGKTTIQFEVRDDVYITGTVRDVVGREITKLVDDETNQVLEEIYIEKGVHNATLEFTNIEAQGMYEVILIAYPVNDPGIEISRAVVKLQHLVN